MAMLIATFMLVAASVAGFTINYYLLRSHVDPDVVVYTAHDDRRPSILIIVIENVGAGPAFDVRFKFCREIELEAANNPANSPIANAWRPMREGPLVDGIPLLGAGGRRVLTWGTYPAVHETFGDAPVRVSASYESRRRFPWDPTEHTANSVLETRSFRATDASSPLELRGVEALEALSDDLSAMRRHVKAMSEWLAQSEIQQKIEQFRRHRTGDSDPPAGIGADG